MKKLVLIAEIDDDTDREAEESLDALRHYLATSDLDLYEGITVYRATPGELEETIEEGPFVNIKFDDDRREFASDLEHAETLDPVSKTETIEERFQIDGHRVRRREVTNEGNDTSVTWESYYGTFGPSNASRLSGLDYTEEELEEIYQREVK